MDGLHGYACGNVECWHVCISARAEQDARAETIVYFPCGGDELEMLPRITGKMCEVVRSGECEPFVLAGFLSADWNRDFSPWPAPALFKKAGDFSGCGGQTLAWMTEHYLPDVGQRLGGAPPRRMIMGYSLAGLFALWCLYQTDVFSGCASCSGSLWYAGWMDYAKAHAPAAGRVYLSLGSREEKARNQVMAAVGANTRATAALLETKLPAAEVVLEWNEGGHFDDVDGRIVKALRWLLRR